MNTAILQLIDTLDNVQAPLTFFLRDDDAGWEDSRLYSLLDLIEKLNRPIDLAVIPCAVHQDLACELRNRIDCTAGKLRIHQHGYAHLNHQAEGRFCEFGSDRQLSVQKSDLILGTRLLRDHFHERLDTLFTPPWNRCSVDTPKLLAELGFAALSRDRSASAQQELQELSVDVDWSKHYRNAGLQGVVHALRMAILARQRDRGALGLMLHHAAMDSSELARLQLILSALAQHPKIQWVNMKTLSENLAFAPSTLQVINKGSCREEAH